MTANSLAPFSEGFEPLGEAGVLPLLGASV